MTTNEKAPGACDSKGLTTDTNDLNFATGQRRSKAIATQIAEFAMAGHAVHQLVNGGYSVTRWDLARHCADFAELQSLARQMGVSHD
jgi:hypothetical protein